MKITYYKEGKLNITKTAKSYAGFYIHRYTERILKLLMDNGIVELQS